MQTYTYTIETTNKTFEYSTPLPYVEAVLYHISNNGLVPTTIKYNNILIDPHSPDYNVKHYKKNYMKIMNNQTRYRSSKLFHVSKLDEKKL